MKKNELKSKAAAYIKIVEWSDEDGCFVGSCPGLMFGGVHGKDEAKVYAELCTAVEEVIALMDAEGHRLPPGPAQRSYNGKVLLRLQPAVHRRLALQAKASGESLNAFLARKLMVA